jgi:hypothetical protein
MEPFRLFVTVNLKSSCLYGYLTRWLRMCRTLILSPAFSASWTQRGFPTCILDDLSTLTVSTRVKPSEIYLYFLSRDTIVNLVHIEPLLSIGKGTTY